MTLQQTRAVALKAIRTRRQERWKRAVREQMPILMQGVDKGKVKLTFLNIDGVLNGVFEPLEESQPGWGTHD